MPEPVFSLKESFAEGWQLTKEYFWKFWLAMLIIGSVSFALNTLTEQAGDSWQGLVLGLITFVIGSTLDLGLSSMVLRWQGGERAEVEDLLSQYRLVPAYIGSSILYGVGVFGLFVVGMLSSISTHEPAAILFTAATVIPLVYFGIRWQFYTYTMVHKRLGPIESLRESMRITRHVFSLLVLLWLALFLLNVLGFIFLGIGLFATIPCSVFTIVSVYRKLLRAADDDDKEREKVTAPLEPIAEAPVAAYNVSQMEDSGMSA